MEDSWGSRHQPAECSPSCSVLPVLSAPAPAGSLRSSRRSRFLRRRAVEIDFDQLLNDLVAAEDAAAASTLTPEDEIDPAERALLIQLYRELVSTIEGPVVPFPVELLADPALAVERPEGATVLDLDAFRTCRTSRG